MHLLRRRPSFFTALAMLGTIVAGTLTVALPAFADDQADAAFAVRMFAGAAVKQKAYACFVRRYDAEHLAASIRCRRSA